MELVRADACAARPVEPVALGSELHVPEMGQPSPVLACALKGARNRPAPPLAIGDFALQVQKPTAFGDRRHAGFHRAPHRLAHRRVLGELPRMELRVAAPQIEGACPPGQLAITQGAEKGQLATKVLERAQVLLVVERERLVTRDADDGPRSRDRLQPVRFLADIGGRRSYFEQAVDVDALFHQLGHLVDARGELLDLVGGHKPQMPAFERERLVGGDITQNRDARVLLDRRRRVGASSGARLVQHDAAHVRTRQELGDAADYGGER